MRRWLETESAISGSSSSRTVPFGSLGKLSREEREHHLPVARDAQEFEHLGLVLEEFELRARIVLLGVEQVAPAELHVARFEAVDVSLDLLAAERVMDANSAASIFPSRSRPAA